jgi:hypothetical protein
MGSDPSKEGVMELVRLADSGEQAGGVDLIASHAFGDVIVTAVRVSNGKNLKLITWKASKSAITRLEDSSVDDQPTQLAIAVPSKVITAHRDKDNHRLYLTAWDVNDITGAITASEHWGLGGVHTPEISDSDIALAGVAGNRWVVAFRTTSGNLMLQSWGFGANGVMKFFKDSGSQGAVSRIAMTTTSQGLVVTAVRAGNGRLKLISWKVGADGAVKRLADSSTQAGGVDLASITRVDSRIVTAVRVAEDGRLRLISWDVDASGAITRRGDSGDLAGAVSEIAEVDLVDDSVVTAVRDGAGKLKLINWGLKPDGGFARLGDSNGHAGPASRITIRLYKDMVVTPVREDQTGRLKLIGWKKS